MTLQEQLNQELSSSQSIQEAFTTRSAANGGGCNNMHITWNDKRNGVFCIREKGMNGMDLIQCSNEEALADFIEYNLEVRNANDSKNWASQMMAMPVFGAEVLHDSEYTVFRLQ